MKLKFQPSVYVAREAGESAGDFVRRVLRDPRLLPDQRTSLEQEPASVFDDMLRGIWLEQAPIATSVQQEVG